MHVLGVKIVDETFEQALERLEPILAGRAATALFFVNAHTLNLTASDPGYRRELNEADLVYGDGTGVRWAAKARGVRLKANLNGTDASGQKTRARRCSKDRVARAKARISATLRSLRRPSVMVLPGVFDHVQNVFKVTPLEYRFSTRSVDPWYVL